MHPVDLRNHLRRQPFEPLRVHISDGTHYDVRHPEMMSVSRTEIVIAVGGGNGDLPERFVYCDPLHITRVEPLIEDRARSRRKKK